MEFRYEDTRIQKYVRRLVSILTAAAGIFATVSKENIEPAFHEFLKKIDPTKLTTNEGFLEIAYLIVLGSLLYILSDKIIIRIAEFMLSRRSKLYGWWIYGFKVNDPDVLKDLKDHSVKESNIADKDHEMYVIGKFRLIHKVTGMTITDRGQSDYLVFKTKENGEFEAHIEIRGTWLPYEIISNQNYSELWIIYHFEKLLSDDLSYYDGLMKLSNTYRGSILKGKNWYGRLKAWLRNKFSENWKWRILKPIYWILQMIHHQNYLYKGIIKDLNDEGIKFSPMFAEKVPYEINDVDEIDELIKNNAILIKKTIDDLKTHKSI